MRAYKYIVRAYVMLVVIIISITTISCKTQYIAGETITERVEIHHRDTTIITEPDSATTVALLRCDSNNIVILERIQAIEGERIRLQYQLNHIGNVTEMIIDCKEDSLRNVIDIQDRQIKTLIERNVVQIEKQKDFIWYTGLFAIIIVAIVLVFFIIIMIIKVVK